MTAIKTKTKTLDELATEARRFLKRARKSLWYYKQAGDCLREAHDRMPHGQWQAWLAENFDRVTPQQARKYVRLSENWDRIRPQSERNPDLGLEAALALCKDDDDKCGAAQRLRFFEDLKPGLEEPGGREKVVPTFIFRDGMVATFNDEICCTRPSPFRGIDGAVPAKPMLDLLAKLGDDEVDLSQGDGELLVTATKGRKAGFRMQPEFVLSEVEEPGEWLPLPAGFDEAIQIVSACASNDDARFALICVHFHPKYIEALDNTQLARYRIKMPIKEEFLLRATAVRAAARLRVDSFNETDGWVHFKNPNGVVLSCRRYVDVKFPDLTPLLDVKGDPIDLPKGLGQAASAAAVFLDPTEKVHVRLDRGTLRLCGEGELGWFRQSFVTDWTGPDMEFRVAPKLLVELAKKHNQCKIAHARLLVRSGLYDWVACLAKPEKKAEVTERQVKEKIRKRRANTEDEE